MPRGELWILPDGGDPLHVGAGDIAITRGPDHYSVVDHPDTEPTITIFPGQDCHDENGDTVEESMSLGVRSWGNHHEGETIMMVGATGNDPSRASSHRRNRRGTSGSYGGRMRWGRRLRDASP